jgi:phosphatidylserine decarboxylase
MPIARGSGPLILTALVTTAGLAAWAVTSDRTLVPWTLVGVGAAFSVLCLWFFRDPETNLIGVHPDLVIAPGQGKVTGIEEAEELDHMGGACRRISIFLSILDVHVQRAPIGGKIVHRSRREGGFLAAWDPKAGDLNARASIGIETASGPVMVRQITGLVARRIVTYPAIGDQVDRGDRVGLIRFGSRVDLFVPLDWTVLCAPGDRAVAGVTPLARVPGTHQPTDGPTDRPADRPADGPTNGPTNGAADRPREDFTDA